MTPKKTMKRKRLVRGRDWHGWANEYPTPGGKWKLGWYSPLLRPAGKAPNNGRWVKVKFMVVK